MNTRTRIILYAASVIVVAAATFAVLLLVENISRRKAEATAVAFAVVELDEETIDPATWGKNFPMQYDTYLRTVDTVRTRYGGSEAFSKLDMRPVWKELFAGYAFGIDYREERGHAYMLFDQRTTERVTERQQPGACLHCHAAVTQAYYEVGVDSGVSPDDREAAIMRGFEEVCAWPYEEATALVEHPVSCVDCHDPTDMQLRVTRPAFLAGIQRLAESDDEVPHLPSIERWRQGSREDPYDVNERASRQEMRIFVCGQCHVEYYFKGEKKTLTYPWHNGLSAEEAEAYYDDADFADWTHARTGAPMLKAQHPEFETWSQGVHARAGVTCADCHMPYMRVGAVKISNHHVRSPLLGINRSCQICHSVPEDELRARAEIKQATTNELIARAETANMDLIRAIERAREAGATAGELENSLRFHRKAQWRLDYVFAENSRGFHAPQETARLLAESMDYARQGELAALGTLLAER